MIVLLPEGAAGAGSVERAAQHEAPDHQQGRPDHEGEEEEPAGELELGQVAADAQERRGQQAPVTTALYSSAPAPNTPRS